MYVFLSHITFRTSNINLVQIQLQIQILIYIKSNTNLDVCRKPKIITIIIKTKEQLNKLFQRVKRMETLLECGKKSWESARII